MAVWSDGIRTGRTINGVATTAGTVEDGITGNGPIRVTEVVHHTIETVHTIVDDVN